MEVVDSEEKIEGTEGTTTLVEAEEIGRKSPQKVARSELQLLEKKLPAGTMLGHLVEAVSLTGEYEIMQRVNVYEEEFGLYRAHC